MAIDEADAGRFVEGGQHALVLEIGRVGAVATALAAFSRRLRSGSANAIQASPVPCRTAAAGAALELLERHIEREAGVPGERLGEAQ